MTKFVVIGGTISTVNSVGRVTRNLRKKQHRSMEYSASAEQALPPPHPPVLSLNKAVFTHLPASKVFPLLHAGEPLLTRSFKSHFTYSLYLQGDTVSIHQSQLRKYAHVVDVANMTTSNAFMQNTGIKGVFPPDKLVCAKFLGTLGGEWPTPQRGHWFPNPGDVDSYRNNIRALCPITSEKLNSVKKKRKYKLLIYQRDYSRKISNQEGLCHSLTHSRTYLPSSICFTEAIAMLKQKLPESDWEITLLMHSNDRSPCELAHQLSHVDVLVTPHGFQSLLLLFLPRPAILFEVFPYRYYKRAYGPLSLEYGLVHVGSMSPPQTWWSTYFIHLVSSAYCMDSAECRGFARQSDVAVTKLGVDKLLNSIHVNLDRFGDSNRDYLFN